MECAFRKRQQVIKKVACGTIKGDNRGVCFDLLKKTVQKDLEDRGPVRATSTYRRSFQLFVPSGKLPGSLVQMLLGSSSMRRYASQSVEGWRREHAIMGMT